MAKPAMKRGPYLPPTQKQFDARLTKLLADRREMSRAEIQKALKMSEMTVKRRLTVAREDGLIVFRTVDRVPMWSLNREGLRIVRDDEPDDDGIYFRRKLGTNERAQVAQTIDFARALPRDPILRFVAHVTA